jgi:altronate hydrolase
MEAIKIYENDNVAVALKNLFKSDEVMVGFKTIVLSEDIPNGHKFSLTNISKGSSVIKYDNIIGTATKYIPIGAWVHDHNIQTNANVVKEYTYQYDFNEVIVPKITEETFMGYSRTQSTSGIRNHLAVIPTVFCANGPLQQIAKLAAEKFPKKDNFDGILPLTHPYGCSQTGKDLEITTKTLTGVIKNPNFGGVLIISLGCEINDLENLKKQLGEYDEKRIRFLVLQDVDDEMAEGLKICEEIYNEMKEDYRSSVTFDTLHVALNCGGSDGYSGITANKLLGKLAEKIVSKGATVSLTEVPEMFGAEHLLMNRAENLNIFNDIVDLINNYTEYFNRYGEKVSDNPTQGNKAGGLSTIEEKSLGCIQKGGRCQITEVLNYGERSSKNGLILVSGPGNDLVGVTGQIAAGAVLTIFTTGRGTPCGFAGPTFRLSSNSGLANKKSSWIDFNAGVMIDDNSEEAQLKIFNQLYENFSKTINGEYITKNEINGYYQMGILRDGVTL